MDKPILVLAGATGDLAGRIAHALAARGATVRAIVRRGTPSARTQTLQAQGVSIATVDPDSARALAAACEGAECVVSALSGLAPVILRLQTVLLDAATEAGVRRFIPSDYAIDFTRLPPGSNRNLDLRRDFRARLATRRIASTSILNGAFADLLTGQAPIILSGLRRVLYWGDADQPLDFTSRDDVAVFTAAVALDPSAPAQLHVAGDRISARELADLASEVTGHHHRLLRGGSLDALARLIRVARVVAPQPGALYPPWQGMQYLHNMFGGKALPERLDNDRYPEIRWQTARDVLVAHQALVINRTRSGGTGSPGGV